MFAPDGLNAELSTGHVRDYWPQFRADEFDMYLFSWSPGTFDREHPVLFLSHTQDKIAYIPLYTQPLRWTAKDNINLVQRGIPFYASLGKSKLNAMAYFIIKRLIQSIFVMLDADFLAFSLFRFIDDPITQMTGVETSVEDQERLRKELGLDDPFALQFAQFTGKMLKGDFGFYYRTVQPAAEMITLVGVSFLTFALGIMLLYFFGV